jgi:hypothetical protein
VSDDGVIDFLSGDGGRDWFLLDLDGNAQDVSDAQVNEILSDIDLEFLQNPEN